MDKINIFCSIEDRITLKAGKGFCMVCPGDIVCFCIEGKKLIATLITNENFEVFHCLKTIETMLPQGAFYRCHAKSLINLKHINSYKHKTREVILSNNRAIKVAFDRKTAFKQLLESKLISANKK